MLAALQRELKDLIGDGRTEEVLDRLLGEVLPGSGEAFNQAMTQKASFGELQEGIINGILEDKDIRLKRNQINYALLQIIDRLVPADLHAAVRDLTEQARQVPDFHALGVNRTPQVEQFEMDRFFSPDPDCRVFFYYLHGDLRQEGPALVQRLGLELSGRRLEAAALTETFHGRQPIMIDTKPEPRGNAQLFQILLLKSLVEKFVGPVNNLQDLKNKTLADLMSSPRLSNLTADDAVCITVRLDHYNWNKAVVPPVLRNLYETFCNCTLPSTAPKFYFFFGLEYPKDKPAVRQEVAEAIAARQYGQAMEELQPVSAAEIAEWFTRHPPLLAEGLEAEEMVARHFPAALATHDMKDVITTLQRLIDAYNKGESLRQKN
ncbi:hypothetical protein QWY85_05745 [Neolewinella lacunae]|uniref:Uncharacterized protein n=1 Tax=Neolewinella lacunae TaxID=1517758 RepID=A0A923PKN7_9BACT|nr:hypothetical protein [Neolewinella lacunae]MBC6994461.1 hypothetical protein [Neolewinella lacunae]MDN3634154.1 hypothetical protein [Neolewinella lacunae]